MRSGRARKQHLHRLEDPGLQPRWSGHDQRLSPMRDVVSVHDEKGNSAEVVAVKVREQDGVDEQGVHPETLHSDERGSAAVDEQVRRRRAHVEAGLEAAPAPESVSASQKLYADLLHTYPSQDPGTGRVFDEP